MTPEAMLEAVWVLLDFYQDMTPGLAEKQGIVYPADLGRVICGRLEAIGGIGGDHHPTSPGSS